MRGIGWPAVPNRTNSLLLSILYQLDQSQWWEADIIRQAQFGQLQRLLRHAWRTVPVYRERFEKAGIDPEQPLDDEHWSRLPLLTRDDLQQLDFSSRKVPARHGRTYKTQTSGSTGQPVKLTGTEITQLFWHVTTLRDHQWHRRDFSGRLASIRATGDTSKPSVNDDWGAPVKNVYGSGPCGSLGIGADISRQAEWLQQFNPDYLLTFPSNLLALIEYCEDRGMRLPRLREVRTISETVSERARRACTGIWQVPLTDIYSCQEVGYVTLQCPDYPDRHHVQAESVKVEILDDDNQPCKPGQVGRLVVTSLNNFATPVLRYELRDLAEAGEACPCGRGLPVINRVLGRERGMLVLPGGEKHWPLTGYQQYGEIAPSVTQFQFIQHSLEQVEARLVVSRPLDRQEEAALRAHIQASLGHPFEIMFTYHDRIPRSASGKFEEFISRVT